MKRNAFVEEVSLRPEVPYRELIIYDGLWNFEPRRGVVGLTGRCHLTIYQKGDIILGISHEAEGLNGTTGPTMGQGAVEIWTAVKDIHPSKYYAFVQGHNGYYEYVNLHENIGKPMGLHRGFLTYIISLDETTGWTASWSPAGTLQEVLERHLS